MIAVLRIAAVVLGLALATIGMLIGIRERYRAAGPLMEDVALAVALVVCGTAAIAWALWSWRRQSGRTKEPMSWAVMIALYGVFVWGMLGPKYGREVCGAWAMIESITMRMMIQTMTEQARSGENEVLSPTNVLLQLGADRLIDHYCGCLSSKELRAGTLTYADVRSGRVTEAEFIDVIRSAAESEQTWERIGMYVFSRDQRALSSSSYYVIVAYSLPPPGCESSWMLVGFADARIEILDLTNLDLIERSLEEMSRHGFPLPPDDLVAHARARGAGLK